VLLPRRGDLLAELVEERLVVVEDGLGEVVAQAVDRAVDRREVERTRGEAVEEVLVEEALVERRREALLAVGRLLRRPDGVVLLGGEDDVGPAFAGLGPEGDLALEESAAAGTAIVGLELDLDVGVGLLEGRDGGLPRRVDPTGDLPAWPALRLGEAVFPPAAPGRTRGASAEDEQTGGGGGRHGHEPSDS